MLRKINDGIEQICLTVGFLLLSGFILVVFAKVIVRNIFHIPMMWADEVAITCFIWTVFLGAAVAVRNKLHYTVDLAPEKRKLNLTFDIVAHLFILSFLYVMIVHGYTFTMMGLSRLSTALTIPLAVTFAAIPFSGVCMLFFTIEQIGKDVKRLRTTTNEVSS